MLNRFVQVCQAILIVLLQKALAVFDPIEPEMVITHEALVQLCKILRILYTYLTTLICQVQRIHFLLTGKSLLQLNPKEFKNVKLIF